MFPIILEATNTEEIDTYIKDFIARERYLPYYVFKVVPVKTEISIDQIRAIKRELITESPTKRLFIVYQFHTAAAEAQNAFLKTLEEKNEKNQYVLVVETSESVLPTIRSRSKIIQLATKSASTVSQKTKDLIEQTQTKGLSSLAQVSKMPKDEVVVFFDEAIVYFRSQLSTGKVTAAKAIKKAIELKRLLLSNNLNPQLTIDSFLIFLKKIV